MAKLYIRAVITINKIQTLEMPELISSLLTLLFPIKHW